MGVGDCKLQLAATKPPATMTPAPSHLANPNPAPTTRSGGITLKTFFFSSGYKKWLATSHQPTLGVVSRNPEPKSRLLAQKKSRAANRFCSQKKQTLTPISVHISKFDYQPKKSFRAQKIDTGRRAQKSFLSQKLKKNYNSVPNTRFSAENPPLSPKIDSDPKN